MMNFDHKIPARASELLISKICHDLVSPVGAVNNGIEFLSDMGGDGLEDGLGLIEHSARQASVKLQLFRMCYGAGGSDAQMTGKIIYETFSNYISGSKVTMNWDLMNAMPDQDLPAGFLKTILNAMVFIFDSLPKGGEVKVEMMDTHMRVIGVGEKIRLKEGSVEAFNEKISTDDLTPKSIHGYITKQYALLFGLSLTVEVMDNEIVFDLLIP